MKAIINGLSILKQFIKKHRIVFIIILSVLLYVEYMASSPQNFVALLKENNYDLWNWTLTTVLYTTPW
jgi:hypothetical protein